MNKNYLADLTLYIWIRALSGFFSALPINVSLGIGRAIAMLGFIFPNDRKKTAYRNIRLAFANTDNPRELKLILKQTYLNWGMNFIEALMLPRINLNYLNKYVQDEGLDYVRGILSQNKGVVMMGSHFGSWEILHIGIPQKGRFPFHILARMQKYQMAADYLDKLRREKNCFVLYKGMGSREAISVLKEKKAFGLVIDQGGRTEDTFIKFFGRLTPTPTGVVRFALKFDAPIVAGYIARIKGPYHKLTMLKPYILEKKETQELTFNYNLEKLNQILESYVRKYKSEYFWFHKRWKYSKDKNILVITDGKAGHLRQLEAFLKEFKKNFRQLNPVFNLNIKIVEIKFKNKFKKFLLNLGTFLFGKFFGCLSFLEFALEKKSFLELTNNFSDIVLSSGAAASAANLLITKENYAKSVVLMSPGIFLKRFNIAIVPSHDQVKPRKNIFITKGALNLVDEDYLKKESQLLQNRISYQEKGVFKIGVLIGGDTKKIKLKCSVIKSLIEQLKVFSRELSTELFISTSRRTSKEIEELLKDEFGNYENCKLLVIANEKNISEAVGGMLGLCNVIITSPDSISMISEAASSGKYIVVFRESNVYLTKSLKHDLFLEDLKENNYINLVNVEDLEKTIKHIFYQRPKFNILDNNSVLKEAISRLF